MFIKKTSLGCLYEKKMDARFYMSVGRLRRGASFFKNGRKNEKKPEKMRRE